MEEADFSSTKRAARDGKRLLSISAASGGPYDPVDSGQTQMTDDGIIIQKSKVLINAFFQGI